MQRCIDGAQHGALPRCPECGGGLLKVAAAILTLATLIVALLTMALLTMATLFQVVYAQQHGHGGQGKFSCPGFHDGDAFQRCPYTATSAERLPWVEA